MAHTKGPWRDSGYLGAGRIVDADEADIAVVYGPGVTPDGLANATLIAEAPTLAALAARAARQLEANAVCLSDPVFKAKTLALAEEIRMELRAAGIDPDASV